MLTIRLTRKGKKNQPFFRVVLVDKRRSSTGGRSIEDLGYVDPLKKRRSLKAERIKYWLSKGAKASTTIHNLLVTEKVINEPKIKVSNISKKKQAEIIKASAAAKVAAAPVIASEAKQSQEPVEAEKPAPASAEASASDKSSAGQAGEAKPEIPAA